MIQSLLTQAEYDQYSKIYKTYNPGHRRTMFGSKDSAPPPNYIMGNSLTPDEIKRVNTNLDELAKYLKEKLNEVVLD